MSFILKVVDYLKNGTVLGGFQRYRIIHEVSDFLGITPTEVYNIGRSYYSVARPSNVYADKNIICRYAYVSTTPMKRVEPLYKHVRGGKVLDFGSGIGIYFDPIRSNKKYIKYFLDIPGPAFEFVKYKYGRSYEKAYFIEAPCDDWGDNYDLVILTDVLEHLEKPPQILRQILNTIKNQGFLLYYFNENRSKAGHLNESVDMKPLCDQILNEQCSPVCSLKYNPSVNLWRKK